MRVLEAWQRRSEAVASPLASLYVEGLSPRDYERALAPVLAGDGAVALDGEPGQRADQARGRGLVVAREFAGHWENVYPEATCIWGADLADCLTLSRFPPRHWKHLHTSNALERIFKEVKQRMRVISCFPTEMAALSLVWSVMDRQAGKWCGVKMDNARRRLLEGAVHSLVQQPIVAQGFEELLAA